MLASTKADLNVSTMSLLGHGCSWPACTEAFVTTRTGTVQVAWTTPLSKCENISTMNRSSHPLYHQGKNVTILIWVTVKWWMMHWEQHCFHKSLFPVAQIKREGCRQENFAGLGPQHYEAGLKDNPSVGFSAFYRRKDPQRKDLSRQLDRCLQKR